MNEEEVNPLRPSHVGNLSQSLVSSDYADGTSSSLRETSIKIQGVTYPKSRN